MIEIFGYQKQEECKKKGDQNVIKKQSRIETQYINVTCRFGRRFTICQSVSMLTIFSLFSCYLLTIVLSMFCFPMSPQSLFDCFFSACCTNTPTYVHYLLADFLTQDLTKKVNLHFQWLPVVASLNGRQIRGSSCLKST